MALSVNSELVREIAERIDDGRPVDLRDLSRRLNVDAYDLYEAYRELARQRGNDPLLERARQRYAAARRAAAPRR